jgi:anti-anti-sigma regulatory factor
VAIVSPEGDVRRVLELTAVDKLIRVYASLEQAVKAVQTTDP